MSRFDACLPYVLQHEGGFVDDDQDPGGATAYGVTQAELTAYLKRPATVADVKALAPATVAPLYRADYWDRAGCDNLPDGVDYLQFDGAVQHGPRRAIEFLQQAVGVTPDGVIGTKTLAAVKATPVKQIIANIRAEREAFYRSLDTFPRFGRGWLNRLAETTSQALAWTA